MLKTHYRQPIDWTVKALEEAERVLDRWYSTLSRVGFEQASPPGEFVDLLSDDLNTPKAISFLHEYGSRANSVWVESGPPRIPDDLGTPSATKLVAAGRLLGIFSELSFKQRKQRALLDETQTSKVQSLLAERRAAREARDFAKADRIRDELASMGVLLKDAKDPKTGELVTTWEVAR
jgi:cysteinyl-tRNA synthetase